MDWREVGVETQPAKTFLQGLLLLNKHHDTEKILQIIYHLVHTVALKKYMPCKMLIWSNRFEK